MKTIKSAVVLLVLFMLYYLIPLNFRNLWQPDETRYAEISREMLAGGDWMVPHFLGLRYFEKPVAGYWINNISQWLLGGNNFAVRFGAVFSVSLIALLVYRMTFYSWREKRTAVMAVLIYLTCVLVYGIGSYAVLDPMIALWLAVSMYCFWLATQARTVQSKAGAYLLFGLACGLGFMTKGFLALAVPVLGVLPWVIQQKRWKEVLVFGVLVALPGALVISLPWVIAIARREPDFWHYFFWIEHIQRFAEKDAQHKAPFWYYLPVLVIGTLPWLALLPGSLVRAWRERRENSAAFYLLGWVVMPFLFFSIAKGKLPTYTLPCFAPLAMLMARYATQLIQQKKRVFSINGWINLGFGLLCALAIGLFLSPWGPVHHPLYAPDESGKVMLVLLAFLFWGAIGALSLRAPAARWHWVAVCPLGLAMVIGVALPRRVIDSKQPQPFIQRVRADVSDSRFILSNNVGLAAGVAWELKRSDVTLFDEKGELSYGLSYQDAGNRFIPGDMFTPWLADHRRNGKVSLLLMISSGKDDISKGLPVADKTYVQGRYMLVEYLQRP